MGARFPRFWIVRFHPFPASFSQLLPGTSETPPTAAQLAETTPKRYPFSCPFSIGNPLGDPWISMDAICRLRFPPKLQNTPQIHPQVQKTYISYQQNWCHKQHCPQESRSAPSGPKLKHMSAGCCLHGPSLTRLSSDFSGPLALCKAPSTLGHPHPFQPHRAHKKCPWAAPWGRGWVHECSPFVFA